MLYIRHNGLFFFKFNIQCVEEDDDGGRTHILRLESLVQFMEGGEGILNSFSLKQVYLIVLSLDILPSSALF